MQGIRELRTVLAKTNEGLDAIGRGEAIGAVAIALISKTAAEAQN